MADVCDETANVSPAASEAPGEHRPEQIHDRLVSALKARNLGKSNQVVASDRAVRPHPDVGRNGESFKVLVPQVDVDLGRGLGPGPGLVAGGKVGSIASAIGVLVVMQISKQRRRTQQTALDRELLIRQPDPAPSRKSIAGRVARTL